MITKFLITLILAHNSKNYKILELIFIQNFVTELKIVLVKYISHLLSFSKLSFYPMTLIQGTILLEYR